AADEEHLEALAARVPMVSKSTVARAALRLGMAELDADLGKLLTASPSVDAKGGGKKVRTKKEGSDVSASRPQGSPPAEEENRPMTIIAPTRVESDVSGLGQWLALGEKCLAGEFDKDVEAKMTMVVLRNVLACLDSSRNAELGRLLKAAERASDRFGLAGEI